MSETIAQVPRIYNRGLQEQPFSLMELMSGVEGHPDSNIRRGSFYLNGVILTTDGKPLRTTDFVAFRYITSVDSNPRIPGILANERWSAIVSSDISRIFLLPTLDTRGRINYFASFSDPYKAKLGPAGWWLYTGGLTEALQEFSQLGWTFDLAKHVSSREEALQISTQPQKYPLLQSVSLLLVKEALSVGAALEIISQQP